ncbi:MAG: electron transfer flavoprotein subunit beta/FixA family protein [Candidatus Brocadiia bacterium]
MHIITCVKQVPDTTHVEVDRETGTLQREGVESVLNPHDAFAVEEALRLRELYGGTVTALSMGPPQAEDVLRQVIAYGVDTAVLISGTEFAGSDTWATSLALARAIETLPAAELIICGKQAVDGDTAHVGPELAVHLDRPQATCVTAIREILRGDQADHGPVESTDGHMILERITDTGSQVLRLPLPAVITTVKDLNEPRLPNLKDLHRGRFADVRVLNARDVAVKPDEVGLDGSPTRVVEISSPPGERAGYLYEDDLDDGLDTIATKLESEGLL